MPEAPYYQVAIGGLMRCCIESIHDYMDANPQAEPVVTIPCKYESTDETKAIFGPGRVWRWVGTPDGEQA